MLRISDAVWREIRSAYAGGIGLRELARKMGIPAGTVLARSKREGWTRQIQDAKTLARPTSQPLARSITEAVAATMAERGQRHLQRMAGIVERTWPAVEAMEPGAILDRMEDVDRFDKVTRRNYGLDEQGSGEVRISIFRGEQPRPIDARVIDAEPD